MWDADQRSDAYDTGESFSLMQTEAIYIELFVQPPSKDMLHIWKET